MVSSPDHPSPVVAAIEDEEGRGEGGRGGEGGEIAIIPHWTTILPFHSRVRQLKGYPAKLR